MSSLPSPGVLLVVLCGAAVGGGLYLLVDSMVPRERGRSGPATSVDLRRLARAAGRRVPLAVAAGLATLLITRWVVLAISAVVLGLLWNSLFGGAREEKVAMARLEGLAAWTESLRDTIAGAVGLEQAIPATAYAAAPGIAAPLRSLADRLAVRTAMPVALRRFADELDDPSADLIIAALILNSRLRGPGLRQVLTSLARSAREELDMRRKVSAERRSTRRSVQIVMGVTLSFVLGLTLLNRAYVEPYGTLLGQVVLAGVVLLFAAGFFWMRRLSTYDMPERFLLTGKVEA